MHLYVYVSTNYRNEPKIAERDQKVSKWISKYFLNCGVLLIGLTTLIIFYKHRVKLDLLHICLCFIRKNGWKYAYGFMNFSFMKSES